MQPPKWLCSLKTPYTIGSMAYTVSLSQAGSSGRVIFESSVGVNFQAELVHSPSGNRGPSRISYRAPKKHRYISVLSACCAASWKEESKSKKSFVCWACGSPCPWDHLDLSFEMSNDYEEANIQFARLLEAVSPDPLEAILAASFLVSAAEFVFDEVKNGRRIREIVLDSSTISY